MTLGSVLPTRSKTIIVPLFRDSPSVHIVQPQTLHAIVVYMPRPPLLPGGNIRSISSSGVSPCLGNQAGLLPVLAA